MLARNGANLAATFDATGIMALADTYGSTSNGYTVKYDSAGNKQTTTDSYSRTDTYL
jgi:hypothetical protein